MKYTPEISKEMLKYNMHKYCPLSFSGKLLKCRTLDCMLYDDEIHECALGRKNLS